MRAQIASPAEIAIPDALALGTAEITRARCAPPKSTDSRSDCESGLARSGSLQMRTPVYLQQIANRAQIVPARMRRSAPELLERNRAQLACSGKRARCAAPDCPLGLAPAHAPDCARSSMEHVSECSFRLHGRSRAGMSVRACARGIAPGSSRTRTCARLPVTDCPFGLLDRNRGQIVRTDG